MHVDAGKGITLVGTAHIIDTSVEEVKQVILEKEPSVVAVELDQARYQALTQKKKYENTTVTRIVKEGKGFLVMAQVLLAMMQRQMSKEYAERKGKKPMKPGAEMIKAIKIAKKQKCDIALADRDITITLRRAWAGMGIIEKIKTMFIFLYAMIGWDRLMEEAEQEDIDQLIEDQDLVSAMFDELAKIAPGTNKALVDERNAYLARKILDAKKKTKGPLVAVIGAGHLNGVLKYIKKPRTIPDLKELDKVPEKKVNVFKIIAWLIPALLGVMLLYGVYLGISTGEWSKLGWSVALWLILNALFALLGGILAGGHPLSWLVGAAASPITSLNPLIGAGWVAGYTEAVIRKPQVKDMEKLSTIETFKEFYTNRFVKVLLVAALVNLGSSAGAIAAWVLILWNLIF